MGLREWLGISPQVDKEELVEMETDSVEEFIEQVTEKGGKKIDVDPGKEEFRVVETGESLMVYLTNYKSRIGNEVIEFSEVNYEIPGSDKKVADGELQKLEQRNKVTAHVCARELNPRLPEGVKIDFPGGVLNMSEKDYQGWLKDRIDPGVPPFTQRVPLVSWRIGKILIPNKKV